MTKFYFILYIFMLAFTFCDAQTEEEAVKQAFDNYKSAIMNDQGEVAVKFVDSKTINYYSEVAQLALTADSLQLDSMDVLDKLMVLLVRYRTPKEKLNTLDGETLLVYSIQEGMVGKNSVEHNEIGEIEITDNLAKAQLVSQGMEVPYYFDFNKEDGKWKLDLTSLFEMGSYAIESMVQQSGMTENELIMTMFDMLEGVIPASDVWKVSTDK